MIRAQTLEDIARLRAAIERVGRLSDGLFRLGPLRIGVDGVLAWIPFAPVGAIYSLAAGLYLLVQGYRAYAPARVLAAAAALIGLRTLVTVVGEESLPLLASELAVDLFRAHKWSADLLIRAVDDTHYVEGPNDRSNPRFAGAGEAQAARGRRRRVFLG